MKTVKFFLVIIITFSFVIVSYGQKRIFWVAEDHSMHSKSTKFIFDKIINNKKNIHWYIYIEGNAKDIPQEGKKISSCYVFDEDPLLSVRRRSSIMSEIIPSGLGYKPDKNNLFFNTNQKTIQLSYSYIKNNPKLFPTGKINYFKPIGPQFPGMDEFINKNLSQEELFALKRVNKIMREWENQVIEQMSKYESVVINTGLAHSYIFYSLSKNREYKYMKYFIPDEQAITAGCINSYIIEKFR